MQPTNQRTDSNTDCKTIGRKTTTVDLTLMALFVVLIVVCSWISIPTAVPFTLQTFAISLTVLLLGGKRGTMSIAVFLLLGAIGIPVFHNFQGGAGILLGPTGGYLLGFLLTGVVYWIVMAVGKWDKAQGALVPKIVAILLGVVLCYVFGTIWFVHVYTGGEMTYQKAMALCVVPFLVPEIIKQILAFLLSARLAPYIKKVS